MEYFITMNIPNVEISPSKIGKEGVMPHIADYTSIASHPLAIKAVQLMASDPPMFIPKQAEYLLHAITHKDPKSTCSLNTEHEVTSFMGKVFNTIFEALGNRIISSLSNQQALCSSNDKTNSFKDGGLYFTDDEGRQITLMNFEVGIAPNDKKYPQMIATCIKDAHNSHHQNTASTNLIIILEKIKERRNKNDPIYTIKEIGFFVGHFYQKVFQINPLYNSKKILDEKEILIAFSKIINTLNQLSTFSKENCKLFYSSKKLGKDTLCYSLCEGGKEVKKVTKVIERKKSEDPKIEGGVSYVYASSIGATKLGNVKCLVTPRFYLVTHDYIEASNIPKYLSQVIECVKQVQVLCEKGIAHGELTPKNFLFSEEGSTITGFGEFNNNPVVDCNSIGLLLSMMNSPLKNQEIQDLAKEMKNCRDRRMCVGYYSKLYKLQGREKILLHQENTQEGKYFWGNFFHDPQLSYHLERYDHITNSSCVPIDFNGQEIDSDFCFEKKTQISSLLKIYSSPYDEEKEKLVKFIKEKSEDPKFSKFLIKRRVSCGKEVCGVRECKKGLHLNFMCKEHNYDFTEHYNSIFKTLKHEFTTIYDGKKTLIHFLFHQLGE